MLPPCLSSFYSFLNSLAHSQGDNTQVGAVLDHQKSAPFTRFLEPSTDGKNPNIDAQGCFASCTPRCHVSRRTNDSLSSPTNSAPLKQPRLDVRSLLDIALSGVAPLMHVRVAEPVHTGNIHRIVPEFLAIAVPTLSTATTKGNPGTSLTSFVDHDPKQFVPLELARRNFRLQGPPAGFTTSDSDAAASEHLMHKLAGLDEAGAFDAWVISCIQIDPREAYQTMNTVDKVSSCFILSSVFKNILLTPSADIRYGRNSGNRS